jgi:hypothetical protein
MRPRNRMLSSLLALTASMGFGGAGRPDLEPLAPRPLPPTVVQKEGPRSINGRLKQKRCSNEERRIARWAERQRRRRARRMNRR